MVTTVDILFLPFQSTLGSIAENFATKVNHPLLVIYFSQ